MSESIGDINDVEIDEHVVLAKFEGEIEDGNVVERVYLHNGVIERHEYIEDGKVVAVDERGGNDAAN